MTAQQHMAGMYSTSVVDREWVSAVSPSGARAGAGGYPCQGLYYTPRGQRPRTAMIATHYNVDFSEHYLAPLMAERGIGFLGWNTRYRGAESAFLLDHALVDIGVGVRWLREQAGVDTVVLLGNSGGGSLMSAYQSQAITPNIAPETPRRPAAGLEELIAGDLYISLAAHAGRPDVLTNWFDPSITDEADPYSVDPALDLWNTEHGPPYSETFLHRYRDAQIARNHRITDWVLDQREQVAALGLSDRMFPVYRVWADPRMVDPTIEPSRRPANTCYAGDPRAANYGPWGIGMTATLRSWLAMWSLEYSQCQAAPHLARILNPALVINADADTGVFASDAKAIVDALGSTDTSFVSMAADHYFTEPTTARSELADCIAAWVQRYTGP